MGTDLVRRAYREAQVGSLDGKRLDGYAIVFNSLSLDLGGFREQIAPEAVDRALNEGSDVRALCDHDTARVLGRTRAGTLILKKEARGLRSIIHPDLEITYARDMMLSVSRGDKTGMSFGFRVLVDEWDYEGKMPIRTVRDMELSEVSVVSWPAYEATQVDARNVAEALRSLDAFRKANPIRSREWYETRLRLAR